MVSQACPDCHHSTQAREVRLPRPTPASYPLAARSTLERKTSRSTSGRHVSSPHCLAYPDARLDAEGVHGDGWDPGIERTRGGPSATKRNTLALPLRGGDVNPKEREFLHSLDRQVPRAMALTPGTALSTSPYGTAQRPASHSSPLPLSSRSPNSAPNRLYPPASLHCPTLAHPTMDPLPGPLRAHGPRTRRMGSIDVKRRSGWTSG